MTRSKTSHNGTHGAPTPNVQPNEESVPPAESDRISSKAKLMAELVTERKRVYSLNMELVKKLNDNAVSVSKFQSTITAHDRSIANKEVEIAEQKAVVKTYKAKLGAKEASHQPKFSNLDRNKMLLLPSSTINSSQTGETTRVTRPSLLTLDGCWLQPLTG